MAEVGRHILVIFDGTGCSAAGGMRRHFTNAFRMSLAVKGGRREQHVVLYFPGPGSRKVFGQFFSRAFGKEADQILAEAYVSLCSNIYNIKTTKIYVFGFSRGAMIAKALARLIQTSGVLESNDIQLAGHVISHYLYKKSESSLFFAEKVKRKAIEFVGLFDPVLGPENVNIDIETNPSVCENIKYAVELLAMDECRLAYKPDAWHLDDDLTDSNSIKEDLFGFDDRIDLWRDNRLQQIWLPGGHSDIGNPEGGKVITDIAFLTMVERLHYRTKISLNHSYISDVFDSIFKSHQSLTLSWKIRPFAYFKRHIDHDPTNEIHPLYFAIKHLNIKINRGTISNIWFGKNAKYINRGDRSRVYEDHIKTYDFVLDPILGDRGPKHAGVALIRQVVGQIGQQS